MAIGEKDGLPFCEAFRSDDELLAFLQNEVAWISSRTAEGFCRNLFPAPVSASVKEKSAEWTLDTEPWMTNPGGITHGAVSAAILDNVMGILTRTFQRYGGMTSSVSINVNYALPLPIGEKLRITSEIVRSGGKLTFTTASIRLASRPEAVCVSASGVYTRVQ